MQRGGCGRAWSRKSSTPRRSQAWCCGMWLLRHACSILVHGCTIVLHGLLHAYIPDMYKLTQQQDHTYLSRNNIIRTLLALLVTNALLHRFDSCLQDTHCQTSGYSLTAQEPHNNIFCAIEAPFPVLTIYPVPIFTQTSLLQDTLPDQWLLADSTGAAQQHHKHTARPLHHLCSAAPL